MRVLFDTDIGSDIDDALALLLLLRIPDVDLVGLTTVYGCTDIRAKVAKKILNAACCSAPVVAGQATPFNSPMPIWHAGTEGDGVLSAEERTATLESMGIAEGAEDFIIEAVQEYGDALTIVSLGALTNIAAALRRHPSLKLKIAQLVFMGGGVTFRRPTPARLKAGYQYMADESHNVRCDVTAASEVFCSGIPMTILTNDVTTRVWWDGPPVQKLIAATSPPEAKIVGELLKVWLNFRSGIFGRSITGTCPHDPMTIAEATGSRFVTFSTGTMTIHDDARTNFVPSERGPHRAAVRVDADDFLTWFSGMMTNDGGGRSLSLD